MSARLSAKRCAWEGSDTAIASGTAESITFGSNCGVVGTRVCRVQHVQHV